MRVGWLADKHDPPGGAELTQAEFRAAAPEGVEVVDCRPEAINRLSGGEPLPLAALAGCERFVAHNHMSFVGLRSLSQQVIRYHHDLRPQTIQGDASICCSPLQAERLGLDEAHLIPPALNLDACRPPRQHRRNGKRNGTCCVGAFMNPGKGAHLVAEWADRNEPVDVYGWGPFLPQGPNVRHKGPLDPRQVAQTLWDYERFVFLPTELEPFGRCVVEAWASGCELIVNGNVGARYWIEEAPEKLETAAEDFWKVVVG